MPAPRLRVLSAVAADGPRHHASVSARASASEVIARILDGRGHVGTWAAVGARMGHRVLEGRDLPCDSTSLLVVHHTSLEFKFTCAADNVTAVAGATPGRMSLRLEQWPLPALRTVVSDRSAGRVLSFRILPERTRELAGVAPSSFDAMRRRFAESPDDAISTFTGTRTKPTLDRSNERILP